MGNTSTYEADRKFLLDCELSERAYQVKMTEACISKHINMHLRIEVETKEIAKNIHNYEFIKAKANFTDSPDREKPEVPCYVASSEWKNLANLPGPTINIMEHLSKLVPKFTNEIGLVTFQNGIQNEDDDFKKMGQSIQKLFAQNILCVSVSIILQMVSALDFMKIC